MATRIYFEIPGAFSEDKTEKLDVLSINIYEGESYAGPFNLIDTVDYNPQHDYVETASQTDLYSWFKLSYLDSLDVESDLSDPVLAEEITNFIDRIASSLGDSDRTDPAFSDAEYVTKIRAASKRYRGVESLASLKDFELELIILLVKLSCCTDLAYDAARYTKITLPDGISINKGERVKHYLDIADRLEKQYLSSVNDLRADDTGGTKERSMEVINTTRRKYFNRGSFSSPR